MEFHEIGNVFFPPNRPNRPPSNGEESKSSWPVVVPVLIIDELDFFFLFQGSPTSEDSSRCATNGPLVVGLDVFFISLIFFPFFLFDAHSDHRAISARPATARPRETFIKIALNELGRRR